MLGLKSQLNKINWGKIGNALVIAVFTVALIALAVLIWLYVRPIQTANIKVPVATDQASYYPGEEISGIFFGDTYYTGEVRVLREVFCKDYKGIIAPPTGAADGDFFSTQGKPRHLEGQTVVVGNLPANIPVGLNCVLQFTNVYEIQTPFGIRREEYQYYTQNFSILTKERRQQLECEASGRKDCNFIIDIPGGKETSPTTIAPSVQSSPETQPSTTNNTTNNTTVNDPAPHYIERCGIDIGLVKAFCTQVLVQ